MSEWSVFNAAAQASGSTGCSQTFAQLHKISNYVIPAEAGIQYYQALSGFRFSLE